MRKLTFVLLGVMLAAVLVLAGCGTGEAVNVGASKTVIQMNEIFALTDAQGNFHLYQYKGADNPSSAAPKIKLKDLENSESIILDYVYQSYVGGIKGGALLKVGLYQAYAGGIDNSKDHYILIVQSKSKKADMPINIAYDPEGKEVKQFGQTISVKI